MADIDKLLARVTETLGAAKAVHESTDATLHPEKAVEPGRWSKRRAWGQPKHRRPPKRHVDTKARPRARCRRLSGRRRVRRVRRFTGSSGHRRRSDAELRNLLAQGAFAGWMEDNVRSALDSTDRAVIICASPSCSGMSMVQRDKAAETWAKHCHTHVHECGGRHERLTVPGMSGTKRHRRRMLRQVRRQHAANARRGLLAELRAHADAQEGWNRSDLDRFEMTAITANTGSNNWNTNGAWVGGVQPTAADDVIIPASAVVTIPTATTALCRSINVQASATIGFATTTSVLTIGDASGGAATFSATCTVTLSGIGTINFIATTGTTLSLTTGGKVMPNLTVNTGSTTTIQAADSLAATGATITLTAGKLDTNNQTVSCLIFSSTNSNTRTLTMGSSAISLTLTSTSSWQVTTSSGLTVSTNTAVVTLTGASNFNTASIDYKGVSVVMTATGSPGWIGANDATIGNFTRTGTAVKTDALSLGVNFTVTGTFTATGNSTTNRVLVSSNILGTPRTITAAAVSLTNVDFQDTTGAGAATWTGTSLGNALGNSGITFTTPVTRFGVVAGAWSSTATWSATTGGAGGASVPLAQDSVVLNASSAAGTYTADMPRAGKDLVCTGFTRTLTVSALTATFFDSVTLSSGMTWTPNSQNFELAGRGSHTFTCAGQTIHTTSGILRITAGGSYTFQDSVVSNGYIFLLLGTLATNNQAVTSKGFSNNFTGTRVVTLGSTNWSCNNSAGGSVWANFATGLTLTVGTSTVTATGTAGTQTITTNAITMPNLTQNGAGGTTQFADAFTTAGTVTLTAGTLDTNSKAVSCSIFSSSNSNTRTLTMGSTALTASFSGTAWDAGTNTSLTVTANTATATLSGASAIFSSGGGVNWNGLSVVLSGSGTQAIRGGSTGTFANVTRTGTAVKTDGVQFGQSSTMTVTGTLTITGNSITNRVLVSSTVLGTARTISAATVVSTNADWQDITAAGAASWDLSAASGGSGDALGNTGITFTTLQTNYYKAAALDNFSTTAKWFLATNGGGGAGRVPLPQDTAVFDGSSGAFAYTMDMPRFGTLTATGFTGTLAFSSVATTTFGNLTLGSATVISGTQTTSLGGRGGQTLTSSGRTFTQTLSLVAFGGTYTQQDAFVGASLTWTNGTWAANNQNVAATNVQSTGAVTRAVTMGSGTWSLTSTSAITVWSVSATLTVTPSTSTITISTASANTRTFAGAGLTYGTLTYTVAASTGPLLLTGANVFTAMTVTSEAGNAKTLTLPSATTTTVTTPTLAGVAGSPLVLNASTPASAATLALAAQAEAVFLAVTDIAAITSQFLAIDSTNVTNNSGITFLPPGVAPGQQRQIHRNVLSPRPAAVRASGW